MRHARFVVIGLTLIIGLFAGFVAGVNPIVAWVLTAISAASVVMTVGVPWWRSRDERKLAASLASKNPEWIVNLARVHGGGRAVFVLHKDGASVWVGGARRDAPWSKLRVGDDIGAGEVLERSGSGDRRIVLLEPIGVFPASAHRVRTVFVAINERALPVAGQQQIDYF